MTDSQEEEDDDVRRDSRRRPSHERASSQISKKWIAGAGLLLTSLFLFFGLGANLLCNIVGFVYPAYESFKAIESKNREDDVQWLMYWVVFGCFHIAEIGIEMLLAWFPFYYAFKLGFLIYCFLPSTRGAQFVYGNIIKPFLETHQVRFESAANSINAQLYEQDSKNQENKKDK